MDMSLSEIATVKNFFSELVTFNQIFSVFFGFLGALHQITPGFCACMDSDDDSGLDWIQPPKQIPDYAPDM